MESTSGLEDRWSVGTNWVIAGGSLANSITVETSETSVDEADASSFPKSPLILRPCSSDSGPCEITINFLQRHEVRQVYVRSTARIYEIYFSPKVRDTNEYLCTVRCGVAAKEEISDMTHLKEPGYPCPTESNDDLDEERPIDHNLSNNDDEWVEVKAPNGSAVPNGPNSLSFKACVDMDLYEATAEISDAEACISLTLRLVSIQTSDCVYVDEVYVFADPVDPESEIQDEKAGNSAGSSLMAMLVPSILQLSKEKNAGSFQLDTHTSGLREIQKLPSSGAGPTESAVPPKESDVAANVKEKNEEVKLEGSNHEHMDSVVVGQPHQTSQNSDVERNRNVPYLNVETLLEQLVSRVSRMEDLYLRFEESMVKPINNIEARLQRVELQLELLNERTLNYAERSCKRFSAPEYSLTESNVNSIYGNDSENFNHGEFEPHKKDSPSNLSVLPDEVSTPEIAQQLLPCLSVTAPEFSLGDDDDDVDNDDDNDNDNYGLESGAESANGKPHHVSIDDALASALAGLVSSIPVQPQKYTQSLLIRAPEFLNEGDGNSEGQASPQRVGLTASTDSSLCMKENDGMKFTEDSHDCIASSLEHEINGNITDTGDQVDDVATENSHQEQQDVREDLQETREMRDVAVRSVEECSSPCLIIQSKENGEAVAETSSYVAPYEREASHDLLQTQISSNSPALETTDAPTPTPRVPKEDSGVESLHNVLAFSCCATMVDFGTSILDVKFLPQEDSGTKSALEGLFGEESKPAHTPCEEITHETCSVGEKHNFIELDDTEAVDDAGASSFTLDVDNCSLPEMPVNPNNEKPEGNHTYNYEELAMGSLI